MSIAKAINVKGWNAIPYLKPIVEKEYMVKTKIPRQPYALTRAGVKWLSDNGTNIFEDTDQQGLFEQKEKALVVDATRAFRFG